VRRWLRRIGIALLALALALTAASLAYNAASGGRERPARTLYPGPFVTVDGTLVAYRTWGHSGTPIVLLGGFVEPSWVWREVGPLLGRGHRVFALDLPPFGYSERRGPYTLARWVSLVRAFGRRLGLRLPVVVGHSLGAAVAVEDALRAPRDVAGIVLLDGDALPIGSGARRLSHLVVDPYYTSLYRIVTGTDWIFRRVLRAARVRGAPGPSAAELAEWKRPFRVDGTPGAFRALLAHGIEGVSLGDLRRVRVPRLVAWGADDTVDSVEAGRRSAAALGSAFIPIPNAGHLSMLDAPRGVAAAVERLARAAARGAH
jgi:pimeloyl-ACP methyl ester carboxylesterase